MFSIKIIKESNATVGTHDLNTQKNIFVFYQVKIGSISVTNLHNNKVFSLVSCFVDWDEPGCSFKFKKRLSFYVYGEKRRKKFGFY